MSKGSLNKRNRTPRRLMTLALAGALALASIVGGALAIASGGDEDARTAHMRGAVASVDERLREVFGIFRSDRLKVSGASAERTRGRNPFGQNTDLSRVVSVARGAIYVIPGDDAVCLGDGINWGHTCVDVETAVDGDLFLVTLGDPKAPYTSVSGLVPDGVAEVSVTLGGGRTVTVPVRDNVYDLRVPGQAPPVTGISWVDEAGERHAVALPDGGVRRPSIEAVARG